MNLPIQDRLTGVNDFPQQRFESGGEVWNHIAKAGPQVQIDGHTIDARKALVDANKAQLAIEDGEPDGRSLVEEIPIPVVNRGRSSRSCRGRHEFSFHISLAHEALPEPK